MFVTGNFGARLRTNPVLFVRNRPLSIPFGTGSRDLVGEFLDVPFYGFEGRLEAVRPSGRG